MMTACTTVLRGAGYVALDGGVPAHSGHSALASQYAHATAPLRRLVDRYVGETCLALCAGTPVPQWVSDELPGLPATMQASSQRAGRYENAVLDLAEAARSEERRVGKACVRTCRSRWSPYHYKKKSPTHYMTTNNQ